MKHLGQLFVGLITAAASSLVVLAAASLAILEGSLNVLPSPTAPPTHTPQPGETITIAPSPTVPEAAVETTRQPTPTACPIPAGWTAYTVQIGDTLESLAEIAGISVDEIYQKNCLPSRTLVVGSILHLPVPTPTPTVSQIPTAEPSATFTFIPCVPRQPLGWVPYIVQPGDTLTRLSLAFNVSVARLMQVNCLSGDLILVGQRLYVPYVPTRTPTVTRTPEPEDTSTQEPTGTEEPTEIIPTTEVPPTEVPPTEPVPPPTEVVPPTEPVPPPTEAVQTTGETPPLE
jgi:LysM repeat protein